MSFFARAAGKTAHRRSFILAALLAVFLSASLIGACGQKGALKLPPDAPNAPSKTAPEAPAK